MKRIGVLSVYNHNYGSILQAYALQTQLRSMGYETEIIKYKKTNLVKQATRLLYFPLLKATVKMKWKNIYCKYLRKDIYTYILINREKEFRDFINKYFVFSEDYCGRHALIEGTKHYDGFILGSDQVWNPMNLGSDFYTMTFIPDDKVKITYAPSFGVSQIPHNQKVKTKEYLKRINCISVRERDGVKIVQELIGRDVPQVVDPTILVEKKVWDDIRGANRIIKEEYIFCYFICANSDYRDFAKRLSEKTKLKLVVIPHVDEFVKADVDFGDIIPEYVGPAQFVNLVSNAKYVCTDSFHGSVFSTLYERAFFTFSRYCKESVDSTNSRLFSFLDLINMQNRMYNPDCEILEEDLAIPDFSRAKKNLRELRKISLEYLRNSLKLIKE